MYIRTQRALAVGVSAREENTYIKMLFAAEWRMIIISSNETEEKRFIKIKSIEANSLYRIDKGYDYCDAKTQTKKDAFLDKGKAVINRSIFSEWIRNHGATVTKNNNSDDFISMKFDYGVQDDKGTMIASTDIREYFYENGASVSWDIYDKSGKLVEVAKNAIEYKMLMRNPGKAKEGECIFIRKALYEKALNYITMGLWKKMPYDNAKIVEMSAYSTLITATAKSFIQIPIENIFVVKDEKVTTKKQALTVKVENGQCVVKRDIGSETSEISNILWDGMGLIDDSIFPEEMNGFIYCRSHFFKSCLFRGSIQKYFKDFYGDDYDTMYVTDMFDRSIKLSDIKVIVTEKSLKWMKFIDLMGGSKIAAFKYYKKWMEKQGNLFSIVKTSCGSKYGDKQRMSFQMNNSLPTTDKDKLERVADTSISYLNNLKIDDEAFLEHLRITGSSKYSINNVLIELCRWNDSFIDTEYFKNKRKNIISKFKTEKLMLGKLMQYGDNLTICGNPIALLMKVTGEDFMNENCFKVIPYGIQCYTTRFADGEHIAGFRSPHNSPNNIVHLENTYPEKIVRYFSKLGNNVIIINGINTDVQSRLNGQDLDTDGIYATNQKEIVELARLAYIKFPTIINGIKELDGRTYKKDMRSYAEMDNTIAASQYDIGYASNIAQLALSYYADGGYKDERLYDVFVICSVLAQVSIDSSKRKFELEKIGDELKRIQKLECMKQEQKYPKFLAEDQMLKSKKKGKKKEIKDDNIRYYNCPMDILYRIIDKNTLDLRKHKNMNRPTKALACVFTYDSSKEEKRKVDRKQREKVIGIVQEYDKKVSAIEKDDNWHDNVSMEFDECMKKIIKLTISDWTMKALIAYAFKDENRSIRDSLLVTLYDRDKEKFLKCFKNKQKIPPIIVKSA